MSLFPLECDACVSKFSDAGGCNCIEDDNCDQFALIPEGCFPCGDKAMVYCDSLIGIYRIEFI